MIELSDLIIAKVLAGRPKDLGDAAALWKLHAASADRPRIVRTLRALEDALGQSDLIRTFDRLGE